MTSYEDFVDRLLPGERVEGWLHPSEATMLARAAERVPAGGCVVEIGSYRGLSTLLLAYGAWRGNMAEVYAVDHHPYLQYSSTGMYGPNDLAEYYRNVSSSPYGSLIRTVNLQSICAAMAFDGGSVDMVFIDGAHDYASVISDLRSWAPKLKRGGLLLMHDSQEPGVACAILDRPPDLHPVGRVKTLAAFVMHASAGLYDWPLDMLGRWFDFDPGVRFA